MAATGTVQLNGSITGLATGQKSFQASLALTNANGTIQYVTLANGANTINVPTSPAPNGVLIQLPSTNTFATTLKGVAGDTGIAIGKTTWFVLPFDPTALPASFVLSSAGLQTAATEISFF